MSSIIVAYILWLFFGLFGTHHYYLKRDRHAFVWFATLGGFGIGWLRDFFRLPNYINEANREEIVAENNVAHNEAAANRRAKVSEMRCVGMLVMGYIFGTLVLSSVPPEWFEAEKRPCKFGGLDVIWLLIWLTPPLAVATGVHLVANIGNLQSSYLWCNIGSYCGLLWTLLSKDPANFGSCCFFSTFTAWWKTIKRRPPRQQRKGHLKRLAILIPCCTIYLLLWGSVIYFNAFITTSDGQQVPIREALPNFFKSPAWKDMKDTFSQLWQEINKNGWGRFYENLLKAFDPEGEAQAYEVLGVSSSSSTEEIKRAYRNLSLVWHPDKHSDPVKKLAAQEKFVQISQAYETLTKVRSRKVKRNEF